MDVLFAFLLSLQLYFRWLPVKLGLIFCGFLILFLVAKRKQIPNIPVRYLALAYTPAILHILALVPYMSDSGDLLRMVQSEVFHTAIWLALIPAAAVADARLLQDKLEGFEIGLGLALVAASSWRVFQQVFWHQGVSKTAMLESLSLSPFTDYNLFAFLLLLSIVSTYAKIESNKKNLRLGIPAILLLSSFVFYSGSRRGLILLLASSALLTFPALIQKQYKRALARSLPAVLGLTLIIGTYNFVTTDFYFNNANRSLLYSLLVRPALGYWSIVMTPQAFDDFYQRIVWRSHPDTPGFQTTDFATTMPAAAVPRIERLRKSAMFIERDFRALDHIAGKSYYLKELGEQFDLPYDYPHNFLLSAYMAHGALGIACILTVFALTIKGLLISSTPLIGHRVLKLAYALILSLTSGLSYWTVLIFPLYSAISIGVFIKSKARKQMESI